MKTIYYKENGKIDRYATFINNNDWILPVVFFAFIIISGLVEGL